MQNMMKPKTGTAITGRRKLSVTVDGDGCATGTAAAVTQWCTNATPKCCQGRKACFNWSADATYTICPGACDGTNSCGFIANREPAGSTVKVGGDACVGDHACYRFHSANDVRATISTIDIGSQSCRAKSACNNVAARAIITSPSRQITVPSNQCNDEKVCSDCALDATDTTVNPLFITTQCCQGKGGASGASHSECNVDPTPASSAGG